MLADYAIGAAVGLAMHEAAHAAAATTRGLRVYGLVIDRRGIGIRRERGTAADTAIIAVAGPIMNLALAAAVWTWLPGAAIANLILGLVNLAPLPASDGLRAASALAGRQ